MTDFQTHYRTSIDVLTTTLRTNVRLGLSSAEARQRLATHGANTITASKGTAWWVILLQQLNSPMVYLLAVAAAISIYFNDWLECIAIIAVIIINALIGFLMEYQAGKSMDALRKLSMVSAKVMRDGALQQISSDEVVPGDIVFVEAGDMVVADARIAEAFQLQANESALTGESVPVEKTPTNLNKEATLADQANMLFKGTFITKGNARAIVVGTGMQTELGKIAHLVEQSRQSATPLEKKLEAFSKKLIVVTVGLVVVIFITAIIMGNPMIETLNTAIALAVAAIPEGLPIVATVGLARAMLRMSKHDVIVKHLASVETLGGTTVICTDKTGTLTENKMTVKTIIEPEGKENGKDTLLQAFVLCNTADVNTDGKEIGDPLETALLKYAQDKVSIQGLRSDYPKVNEEAFSSETKRMITVHQSNTHFIQFVKGASEEVLRLTMYTGSGELINEQQLQHYHNEAERLASAGYKVIAFGVQQTQTADVAVDRFTLLAIVGLIDPPRPEVREAIAQCKSAGIKVVMITGDHPSTAREIGYQLALIDDRESNVILGQQMKPYAALTETDKAQWMETSIFARVTPQQKLDLIQLYQEKNHVVGMTGDGVNDAPALKKADIGIAMGIRGTQVSQDVATMILKDDSFTSIVTAIREGRIIFDNIRKFVIFLLSTNLSEIMIIAAIALFGLSFQLLPLQILFVNLITDVLPALALGVSPGEHGIMKQLSRKASDPIIDGKRWRSIIIYAVVISIFSIGAVLVAEGLTSYSDANTGNNILFFTLIGASLLHVFNMHGAGAHLLRSVVIRNRYVWYSMALNVAILVLIHVVNPVRDVLGIGILSTDQWILVACSSLLSMVVIQGLKLMGVTKQ